MLAILADFTIFVKAIIMVTEIPQGATANEIKAILAKRKTPAKNLKKFVGKLQRGLDGLTYQREIRNEWD